MQEEADKLPDDIFSYITMQEAAYERDISIAGIWDWNMKTHCQEAIVYKYSQTMNDKRKGTIDEIPIKNIIKPIRNVQDAAEDIDVKDCILYVDDPEYYHLSFLIKKYHDDVFIVENDLDTYFDQLKEEKNDFGLCLTMDVGMPKPEIINLQSIAFCDQTDVLSGPIGIKYYFSPSQLKEMEKRGWGSEKYGADQSIDEFLLLAQTYQNRDKTTGDKNETPGKYSEVYMVLGDLPEKYLNDQDTGQYIYQMQIVGFYNTEKGTKGITLFKIKTENPLKAHKRDPIFGRACGWGGIEELVEGQIWTTYSEIRKKEFLDAASKILLLTDDPTISAKHPTGLKNVENLEIIETEIGKKGLWQADTFPRNFQLFDKMVDEWWVHAQTMGSAHNPLLGTESPSGTPFRAQERQVIEGKSIHEYRQGKFAKFIEELYRDWFIPYISKQIVKGTKFLSELSLEEMQEISEKIITKKSNEMIKDRILNEKDITQEEIDQFGQEVRNDFMKSNKKFIEILKDELKNLPIKVKVNIKNKQKSLAMMTDKMTNVIRFVFSTYNPQTQTFAVLQDPQMAKLFNQILEYSGLSPIDYGANSTQPITQPQQPQMPNEMPAMAQQMVQQNAV
jgi:hypothetical protein